MIKQFLEQNTAQIEQILSDDNRMYTMKICEECEYEFMAIEIEMDADVPLQSGSCWHRYCHARNSLISIPLFYVVGLETNSGA